MYDIRTYNIRHQFPSSRQEIQRSLNFNIQIWYSSNVLFHTFLPWEEWPPSLWVMCMKIMETFFLAFIWRFLRSYLNVFIIFGTFFVLLPKYGCDHFSFLVQSVDFLGCPWSLFVDMLYLIRRNNEASRLMIENWYYIR